MAGDAATGSAGRKNAEAEAEAVRDKARVLRTRCSLTAPPGRRIVPSRGQVPPLRGTCYGRLHSKANCSSPTSSTMWFQSSEKRAVLLCTHPHTSVLE